MVTLLVGVGVGVAFVVGGLIVWALVKAKVAATAESAAAVLDKAAENLKK